MKPRHAPRSRGIFLVPRSHHLAARCASDRGQPAPARGVGRVLISPLSVSAASQCPLRSESDRSAALPRVDAICHLRKVRTYSDTAGKNDSGARPPYFVEAVGRRGLIISGNTLDLLGTSSQPEAAFDAAGASSFLLDRANDRRECRKIARHPGLRHTTRRALHRKRSASTGRDASAACKA